MLIDLNNPTVQIAFLGVVGVIVAAGIAVVPNMLTIILTEKARAKREKEAAELVAKEVKKVASKTEEVATNLHETTTETNGKLVKLQDTSDQIHVLVNDKLSEALKRTEIVTGILFRKFPDDPEIKELYEAAVKDVEAHQPARSTIAERGES